MFVACGGIGTTRLVLGSLGAFDQAVYLQESVQFVMPTVSLRPVQTRVGAELHPQPVQPALRRHRGGRRPLPGPLLRLQPGLSRISAGCASAARAADPALGALLRRVSVGLGYVPGWGSPRVKVVARPGVRREGPAPRLEIDGEPGDGWPPMLRALVRAMLKVAPALDLWPVVPMISVSGAAKSYHFGASFPHGAGADDDRTTDRTGRLAAWDRIHLVDASVFPDVPATTFTLTIMANAHRIASETLAAAAMTTPSAGARRWAGSPSSPSPGPRGYLGSVLVAAFEIGRVRRPPPGPVAGTRGRGDRFFDLTSPDSSEALEGVDLLVHCAYDMTG